MGIPVLYEAYNTDMNVVWNTWRKENNVCSDWDRPEADEALIYQLWTTGHIGLVIECRIKI